MKSKSDPASFLSLDVQSLHEKTISYTSEKCQLFSAIHSYLIYLELDALPSHAVLYPYTTLQAMLSAHPPPTAWDHVQRGVGVKAIIFTCLLFIPSSRCKWFEILLHSQANK